MSFLKDLILLSMEEVIQQLENNIREKSPNRQYFIVKANSIESLAKSIREGIWAIPLRKQPPHFYQTLNHALQESEVILIFSVNNTKKYQGYAVMLDAVPTPGAFCSVEPSNYNLIILF